MTTSENSTLIPKEESQTNIPHVGIIRISGSVDVHTKDNDGNLSARPVDSRALQGTMKVLDSSSAEECIERIKQYLLKLDQVLKDI